MKQFLFALTLVAAASPAFANNFAQVSDKETFLSLVEGRELRNRLYGVRLNVGSDGQIQGAAIGWDITGTWSWQDGFFCREMNWGGDVIPYDCQLVEQLGGERLRFTVDRGAGDSASFRLQ